MSFHSSGKKLASLISIDTRTLAVARMGLALLVILDIIARGRSLFAFYDDRGTLPRTFLLTDFASYENISLHMVSGAWYIQLILFIVAGVLAGMLLVGYKTRFATIATWLLLVSVHNRNPLILQAGDTLLRMGLFWGMFLPWGSKLSVDAALKPPTSPVRQVTSVATLAVLGQVALVYLGAALHKSRDIWFVQGNALYLALNLDEFATRLGHWLLQWPQLLTLLSRSTYSLELYAPVLLFVPFFTQRVRLVVVLLLVGLHLGIASTLKIGLFAWTDIAMLIFFLPPLLWDIVTPYLRRISRRHLQIYYDSECSRCRQIVAIIHTFVLPYNANVAPASSNAAIAQLMYEKNSWVVVDDTPVNHFGYDGVVTIAAASPFFFWLTPLLRQHWIVQPGERLYAWIAARRQLACTPEILQPIKQPISPVWQRAAQGLAGFFFLCCVAWNVAAYPGVTWKAPHWLEWVAAVTRIDQHWGVFAPGPPREDGWYVMPGTLQNGTTIDVLTKKTPVSWEKSANVSRTYIDQYWRKYLMLIASSRYAKTRSYYAQYVCGRWNATHTDAEHLTRFSIQYVLEMTPPTPGAPPIPLEYKNLLDYRCSP